MISSVEGNLRVRFEYWPVVWFWPVSLVLMQLALVRLDGFEVTLAVVACHALQLYIVTFYWVTVPRTGPVAVGLFVLLYTLTLGVMAEDAGQFVRSAANIANLLFMTFICLNARLVRHDEIRRSIAVFCVLASMTGALIIAQSLSFNLWHDLRLAGVLGPFAPLGPGYEPYVPLLTSPALRANGVFSEPSVAGWFMGFACALSLAARRIYPILGGLSALICAAGAAATLSLTGVFGIVLIAAAYLLFIRDHECCKLSWLVFGTVGIAVVGYVGMELGIFARFRHLETPGTSIYFRITAPLTLVAESLQTFPLGHPVGQTEYIASRGYYVNWEQGSQTNIDNTLFMVVFYFGALGVLANLTYLLQLVRLLAVRRHAFGLILLSLLIALTTTGAGWAHHFVLLVGYAIFVGRYLLSLPAPVRRRRPAAVVPLPALASLGGGGKRRLRLAVGAE